MAGALRKTMAYLGLAEDAATEYDDGIETPAEEYADVTPISRPSVVSEPIEQVEQVDLRRISTVHPNTYNEARIIGEAFRSGTPVIMNLTNMSEAEAKRMVDFSAGLVFGLHGSIERVTNRVFLLSPASVEVASGAEETENGPGRLFNQS